ncbi:MAG: hypothetical protein HOD43_04735 [Candidatus Marinimicrobia bacterium]|jgi:hypothetical protein|nr:hypothetical protein [Candidatus Neomarinimicrobiota bacterium]MBT4419449.1 hypothetical protein [Candidatus Neomarinimicrobiota bacterium]MBT4993933.1 hypothetical protein [Candidatus Neomarinimicrobiota bacterium]MBT5466645.1 hypothetical protein [Candidatus Neomarinimicrobiota bacterium]MBT6002622.1 hypothetical protein [Candidatus Neomarinimicrobiota bacterium]
MVKTSFDQSNGILHSTFDGNVTIAEIVDYIRATKNNSDYPRELKIITDSEHAEMNFSPADLVQIVEENYKSLERYTFIHDAIVVDSPRVTAMTMLYQELVKTNKYKFEVFSSRETALHWLIEQ